MTLDFLRKTEIIELWQPVFFTSFVIRIFYNTDIFNSGVYPNVMFRDIWFWCAVFAFAAAFMFFATHINTGQNSLTARFSASARRKIRYAAILLCFSVWIVWSISLITSQSAGFGDIIWGFLGLMNLHLCYRAASSPIRK